MPKFSNEHGDRQWFTVNSKKGDNAEVYIYDEIGAGYFGGGVAAEAFIKDIKALNLDNKSELTVRINSPGGNMFEGNTIYNYLRTVKAKVIVRIDGVAASAASLIAMAGDRIEMPSNAMLFIHNPWMMVGGDAATMRKAANDLDQMRDGAAATYLRRTGDKLSRSELLDMLDAETWLSAEDSVKYGLADVVDEPVRATNLAQFDFGKYGLPIPKSFREAKGAVSDDIRRKREQLKKLTAK
jgi:ATP-dependent Clp protease protease subunit